MIFYCGKTDPGRQRKQNEDTILTSGDLFLVCDGMGGRKAGEIASRIAVEAILREISREPSLDGAELPDGSGQTDSQRLKSAIQVANSEIRTLAAESSEHKGMGTTVAAVLFEQGKPCVAYANVGDSRVYLIRAGAITQLSRDDSWVNAVFGPDEVDSTARISLQNVLTKALGTHDDLDFEIRTHDLVDGDVLLLCSDGLTSMVEDTGILAIVSAKRDDLESAAQELIDAANLAGGRDNISAVLVRFGE